MCTRRWIKAIPKKMKGEKADCLTSLMPVPEPQKFGIVGLLENGNKFLRCVEKSKELKSNLAVIGARVFTQSFLGVYPKL